MKKIISHIFKKNKLTHKNAFSEKVKELVAEIEKSPNKVDCPVNHYYGHKCYGREMFAVKGSVIVGKIHKFKTINLLTKGDITIVTEKGINRFKAPMIIESEPFVQKVGYVHEDCTWITFHGTENKNLKKIENELFSSEVINEGLVEKLRGFLCRRR